MPERIVHVGDCMVQVCGDELPKIFFEMFHPNRKVHDGVFFVELANVVATLALRQLLEAAAHRQLDVAVALVPEQFVHALFVPIGAIEKSCVAWKQDKIEPATESGPRGIVELFESGIADSLVEATAAAAAIGVKRKILRHRIANGDEIKLVRIVLLPNTTVLAEQHLFLGGVALKEIGDEGGARLL